VVEETGAPEKNHRLVAGQWQTVSDNVASSTPRHERGSIFSGDLVILNRH
jgi:hypothetical protein